MAEQVAGISADQPIVLTTTEDEPEEDRVPLFLIDDVPYTIPATPRMNLALQYVEASQQGSELMAAGMLLKALLGEKGWKAIREHDQLTPEQFEALCNRAVNITLGAMEEQKAAQAAEQKAANVAAAPRTGPVAGRGKAPAKRARKRSAG